MKRPLHFAPGMLVRPKRSHNVVVWHAYKVQFNERELADSSREVLATLDRKHVRVSMDGKQKSKVDLTSLAIIVCVPFDGLIGFFAPAQNLFAYTWDSYLVAVAV